MPARNADPGGHWELLTRLERLSESERAVLERLSVGELTPRSAPSDVVADIRRKLGVRSTLAAVAVLLRASESH